MPEAQVSWNLGNYNRKISTSSPQAQRAWLDGLIWTYAYNHEEAIVCFQHALNHDPDCAMAHWGIAYAVGPNYNRPWSTFEPAEKAETLTTAHASLAAAQNCTQMTAVERALIEALVQRYPPIHVEESSFDAWHDAYANAMRLVYQQYPHDLDVTALFAEAMMNRTPWQLWDLPSGQAKDGADTVEIVAVLEQAFDGINGAWQHAGLLHLYIHLMEMSPTPEKALRHGDVLVDLVPDSGHLIHMGSHIDVLTGDYYNVVARNQAAVAVDQKYVALRGSEDFYAIYRCHNYHFILYGAMFLGQADAALEAADGLIQALPPTILQSMADWLEAFVPMRQHVLIRFGMWKDILEQELPLDSTLYCFTTAMMRYARTVALANLKQIGQAETELELFQQAATAVPASRMLFNNTCHDILEIAELMATGELLYHKGEYEAAFETLRQAVEKDDGLPYDEPWGWMQPVRHALGALLLEQGHVEEAEGVYRADLGLDGTLARACQHPDNLWSLHGLVECLERRGAGDSMETRLLRQRLDRAVARSTVRVQASCYCRCGGKASE